jgi:hypothetical protein
LSTCGRLSFAEGAYQHIGLLPQNYGEVGKKQTGLDGEAIPSKPEGIVDPRCKNSVCLIPSTSSKSLEF